MRRITAALAAAGLPAGLSVGAAGTADAGSGNYANIPARKGGPDAETRKAGDGGARSTCGVVTR